MDKRVQTGGEQNRESPVRPNGAVQQVYCADVTLLATCENTLLALLPISRTVPITMTRITASITAYSATS